MRQAFVVRELKTVPKDFTEFFPTVNKTLIRDTILAQLRAELALQVGAAHLARDEAISEESRAENKYDTHSQEAAYLAEGQAKLAAEIESNLALYSTLALPAFGPADAIALGALVEVAARGGSTWYFLGPRAGGTEVTLDGRTILVLTPQSPLGRQFLGKRVGDTVPMPGRAGAATGQKILSVQ
jgi:transcription elongation GreA/GreB family factor